MAEEGEKRGGKNGQRRKLNVQLLRHRYTWTDLDAVVSSCFHLCTQRIDANSFGECVFFLLCATSSSVAVTVIPLPPAPSIIRRQTAIIIDPPDDNDDNRSCPRNIYLTFY